MKSDSIFNEKELDKAITHQDDAFNAINNFVNDYYTAMSQDTQNREKFKESLEQIQTLKTNLLKSANNLKNKQTMSPNEFKIEVSTYYNNLKRVLKTMHDSIPNKNQDTLTKYNTLYKKVETAQNSLMGSLKLSSPATLRINVNLEKISNAWNKLDFKNLLQFGKLQWSKITPTKAKPYNMPVQRYTQNKNKYNEFIKQLAPNATVQTFRPKNKQIVSALAVTFKADKEGERQYKSFLLNLVKSAKGLDATFLNKKLKMSQGRLGDKLFIALNLDALQKLIDNSTFKPDMKNSTFPKKNFLSTPAKTSGPLVSRGPLVSDDELNEILSTHLTPTASKDISKDELDKSIDDSLSGLENTFEKDEPVINDENIDDIFNKLQSNLMESLNPDDFNLDDDMDNLSTKNPDNKNDKQDNTPPSRGFKR